MRRLGSFGSAAAMLVASSWAHAVAPTPELGSASFEVAPGEAAVRETRELSWFATPRGSRAAYRRLLAELGPQTLAVWDPATGVPAYVWGRGVAAPGVTADASAAEKHARAFVARHLDLWAPGTAESDFEMVSNDTSRGMRTIGFAQRANGLPIIGAQLSLRYRGDRLFMIANQALPRPDLAFAGPVAHDAALESAAVSWVADVAPGGVALAVDGPFVLPLVGRSVRFRQVMRVKVDASPRAAFDVYLDATSAAPVAREQMLQFADGTVNMNAPERYPDATRLDYAASYASVVVDGTPATCDAAGLVSWPTTVDASVDVTPTGTYVAVSDAAGIGASTTSILPPSGSVVWNAASDEFVDAHLTTYVHANRAIAFARLLDPTLAFTDTQLVANVNIDDECNAFYSRQDSSINFHRQSATCHNTGRLADIVYHEYGHAIHDYAVIPGVGAHDAALSEGWADYVACTITGDPAMGPGFHYTAEPLRDLDPSGYEDSWPAQIAEAHTLGRVIGGAFWDLRKAMIQKHGDPAGIAIADDLAYQALRRSVDIPAVYFELLAADDDDGDLANGTPNVCEIADAFAAHGLRRMLATTNSPESVLPSDAGIEIRLEIVDGLFEQCGTSTPELSWHLRGSPSIGGTLVMEPEGAAHRAIIPAQPDGSVVKYHFEIPTSGLPVTLPHNPADPNYELFVGEVVPIYCTDFEADPALEGWTHGLTVGTPSEANDDWQWGTPAGKAGSGDPDHAYSGVGVWGNDLGPDTWDGRYRSNIVNFSMSPEIPTEGHAHLRLQFRRWLNVEDAHFDQATIYADTVKVWQNYDSNQGDVHSTWHHQDGEWRFQDVDLTAATAGDTVQIVHELATNDGLILGGWTIDDWCVVAWLPVECGDGRLGGDEICDDGDLNDDQAPNACRSTCVPAACGDGVIDDGEACDVDDGTCVDCAIVEEVTPPPSDTTTDDGCGCAVVGAPRSRWSAWLLVALSAARLVHRRRRTTSARAAP